MEGSCNSPTSKRSARERPRADTCASSGTRCCAPRTCGRARPEPVEILGEKFTLYRGEGGDVPSGHFRCPHRGAQLSLGWVEGDDIRCRYHGWRFDCTGQCVEQPERRKVECAPGQDAGLSDARISRPRLRLYRRGRAAEVPAVSRPRPPGRRHHRRDRDHPCSFWNRLDNDINHIPWVHRATALRKGRNDFIIPRKETSRKRPMAGRAPAMPRARRRASATCRARRISSCRTSTSSACARA